MKRKWIVFIAVVVIIVWLIYFMNDISNKAFQSIKNDSLSYTHTIPKDYVRLLKDTNNLSLIKTINSKWRNPISNFKLKNGFISVYKIDTLCDWPLDKLINTDYKSNHVSYNEYYDDYSDDVHFTLEYKSGVISKPSKIYFSIYGNKTNLIEKSDTVLYYKSNFTSFSIRYNNLNSTQDIFSESKNNNTLPLEVLFYKKGTNLYLLTMAVTKDSDKTDLNLFYNLILNK